MAVIPLSFGIGSGASSDEVTATKNQVLSGYTAITSDSEDEPIEGEIPFKNTQNYYVTTSDQSIESGQYLSGAQTIKALSQSNLSAQNVKKGITVTINNGSTNVYSANGTYTTPSSGQSPIVSGAILSGYSGFVNGGSEIRGSIASRSAKTVYATTSDQTVENAGVYQSGAITLKKLTQSNLDSANILRGKTITIGNSGWNVWSVSGAAGTLKRVSGSVSTSGGSSQSLKNYVYGAGGSSYDYSVTKVSINPGITPLYVVCRSYLRDEQPLFAMWDIASDNLWIMKRKGGYNEYGGISYLASSINSILNHASNNLDVFGLSTGVTIYYDVFGY